MKFAIQAERPTSGYTHIYLRSHNDGTLSWTRDPAHARTFRTIEEGVTYARRHTNMACEVVRI
jgi:hypothetical protein